MNPPHHDEPTQQPANTTPLLCRICNKRVPIETARTDSDGKAVHGDCYMREINDQMSSDEGLNKQKRSWLVIAKELSQEQNPTRVTELAKELSKALDEKAALKARTEKARDGQGEGVKTQDSAREDLNMSNRNAPHCAQCGQELELVIDAQTGELTVRECANPDCPNNKVRKVPRRSSKDAPTAA